MTANPRPVLYAVVTGSPAARDVGKLVDKALVAGWVAYVIASPDALEFIDIDSLTAKTGHQVRSRDAHPGTSDALPPPDAIVAAPITCDSVVKWSAGISDTLPLRLLAEAVDRGLPVVAVPYSNNGRLDFPTVRSALNTLSRRGVTVLDTEKPRGQEPAAGHPFAEPVPWNRAWRAVFEHPAADFDDSDPRNARSTAYRTQPESWDRHEVQRASTGRTHPRERPALSLSMGRA